MLRVGVARSARCAEHVLLRSHRVPRPLMRTFADNKTPDKTVLPGTESSAAASKPPAPGLASQASTDTLISNVPKQPPAPPARNAGSSGPGSSSTPPPRRPRRRIRNWLLNIIALSTLGYAGGVYYSLASDNFHDFFTEYVPYGEEVVAYFEEREFKKRFPTKGYESKNWPQMRGENKVTVSRQSGVSPRVAEQANESDLGQKGRHLSAVEGDSKQPGQTQQAHGPGEKTQAAESAKKSQPASDSPAEDPQRRENPSDKANAAQKPPSESVVDHINLPNASEHVVQSLVKMVNNVITAVSASPEASKFSSTIESMKGDLESIVSEIGALKDTTTHEAEAKIRDAHVEFDNAAKELVRRLDSEMREQESKWREEYENEREKLSQSYQQKLQAELEAAKKVADEKNKSSLLQQEIALQKAYMDNVKAKVEQEREGRLAKLDELSSSVQKLEKLTSESNEVVDATLQTQHLQVAVEAVRAKVLESEHPTPFLNELVALKKVSKDDQVVNAAIASINPLAYQRGIATPVSLIDRFRRVASEVRKASLLPEDAGVASHAASAVLSKLMFQKRSDRGLPEGDDVEATLARTEVLLEEGDLDGAAREMNGLKGWAGVLSRDWVSECRRVLGVRQAVDVIATEARLQSLLVK